MPRLRTVLTRVLPAILATDRRRDRRVIPTLTGLEDRVVLSRFGVGAQAFGSRLAFIRHARGPGANHGGTRTTTAAETSTANTTGTTAATTALGNCAGGITQDAQLTADLEKLQTDIRAVYSGSAVTDAQRQALNNDFRALRDAGVVVDKAALQTVADTLLTNLANGTYDQNASTIQTAFTAAFSGTDGAALTSDQTALVNTAYNDFVTVARGLNVDSTELQTLADDRAAIQADLTRLGIGTSDGHGPGQSSNLDLILQGPGGVRGPGPGRGFGRPRGGRF
ncbi:MAG: hypothetical protein U0790_18615 [Isosphaeraceae bacterium]